MTMKKHLIYIIGIAASLFTACENISEDERLLDVEGVTAQRVVLLEDYTGQACVNCPEAHKEAQKVQASHTSNHHSRVKWSNIAILHVKSTSC